ncbi:PREDICTED: uncharacterized protein LOC101296922 [Fragaria vesca subsp. vesca]
MVKGRQGDRVRLYVRGTVLGYKRSKSNQYPNTSLIQIENVNTKEEVAWYAGMHLASIYKAKVKKNGSHYRCIEIFTTVIAFEHWFMGFISTYCPLTLYHSLLIKDGQCPEYSGEDQAICAIGLAKSKPGVFVEAIQYLLILATLVQNNVELD